MLVKEIHHRVKNNLQVVSSLLFLQSRYMDDDSAKGAIKIGRARVQAMSLLHQKLYQKDNLQSVNLKAYFLDLGQNLFDTYQLKDHNIEFVTDIDDFEFDIDTLVPLGLITNELISNALKHAFSEDQHGWIKLSIKKHGAKIHLQVADNGKGIGFTEIPQNSKSLGMELVKSFAEKLGAELKIENKEGSVFTLIFDADRNKFK
jgi:two-component sensor histidine kinase